jgi:proton-coupled amino acid transporter
MACRSRCADGGFEDIAEAAAGRLGRCAVIFAIISTQFGTVIAYMIFCEGLLQDVGVPLSSDAIIAAELVVLVPLSWLRSVQSLGPINLLSDVLMVSGFCMIFAWCGSLIAERGVRLVPPFQPSSWGLAVGAATFAFEGDAVIVPIYESMADKTRWPQVYARTFGFIVVLFVGVGTVGVLAFGDATANIIFGSFDQSSPFNKFIQVGYVVALLGSFPIQFAPAQHLLESIVLSGAPEWLKTAFRCVEVIFFSLLAILGAQDFQVFMAFLGALTCLPLAVIFPAYFHLVLVANTPAEKAVDVVILVSSLALMVFVVFQTCDEQLR